MIIHILIIFYYSFISLPFFTSFEYLLCRFLRLCSAVFYVFS
nr:MAG TPA: hypothetical protein [Herelleviridae sp.]